jgi:hypothetical protein
METLARRSGWPAPAVWCPAHELIRLRLEFIAGIEIEFAGSADEGPRRPALLPI